MSRALDDVVVVDLTTEFFASIAAALLADFGAKVIRVENTGVPAPVKNRDGMHPQEAWDSHAELAHRNKQSVALNLEVPAGDEVHRADAHGRHACLRHHARHGSPRRIR